MDIEEVIKICKDRGEIEFLYSITKVIAESDSIGEAYSYCNEYTREQFNNAEKHIEQEEYVLMGYKDHYCKWLEYSGILIYELYLYQIGALVKQNGA